MIDNGDWRKTLRPNIPSPARIYDYLLGGKRSLSGRQAGEAMIVILPDARTDVRWNRALLQRLVRWRPDPEAEAPAEVTAEVSRSVYLAVVARKP